MCNDYEQHIRWAEYCALMQALKLGVPAYQSELDLPQADDIKINDMAPVMRSRRRYRTFANEFQLPATWAWRTRVQFPIGGTTLCGQQTLPHPGKRLFRIYMDTY